MPTDLFGNPVQPEASAVTASPKRNFRPSVAPPPAPEDNSKTTPVRPYAVVKPEPNITYILHE